MAHVLFSLQSRPGCSNFCQRLLHGPLRLRLRQTKTTVTYLPALPTPTAAACVFKLIVVVMETTALAFKFNHIMPDYLLMPDNVTVGDDSAHDTLQQCMCVSEDVCPEL